MFERLKRALSGSAPEPLAPQAAPTEPGRLDWITEETPYRFRTWLKDPARRGDVIEILDRRLAAELTTTITDEPDGRVRLDIVSTFKGGAAILRPLYQLLHEGVRVRGFEDLDRVVDISRAELTGLPTPGGGPEQPCRGPQDRGAGGQGHPPPRAGCQSGRRTAQWVGHDRASVGRHTPGSGAVLLEKAVAEKDVSRAPA